MTNKDRARIAIMLATEAILDRVERQQDAEVDKFVVHLHLSCEKYSEQQMAGRTYHVTNDRPLYEYASWR